ncbi:MAG: M36 family metallopeptidase [Anaerolineae bacterium]|nr:M36 family metallopeptidase [Anaerolineae bacterium]
MKNGSTKISFGLVGSMLIIAILVLFIAVGGAAGAAGDPLQGASAQDVSFLTGPNAGQPRDIALGYLQQNRAAFGLSAADVSDYVITDQYVSDHNGTTHIYLQQRHAGYLVYNALININIAKDGSVINVGNRFVPNLAQSVNTTKAELTAVQAVNAAADALGLAYEGSLGLQETSSGADQKSVFVNSSLSAEPIPVWLVYQPLENGQVSLAWNVEIHELDHQNIWSIRVDATTGAELDRFNYVIHDHFGTPAKAGGSTAVAASPLRTGNFLLQTGSQYNVFPLPVESPSHGSRAIVSNPANALASPYGWHDTNGSPGAEYTVTRGNNVHAYTDTDNNNSPDTGSSPDGGSSLNFDFPLNLSQAPSTYRPAAVTNLFYWNNIIHDVMYQYGFNEASGNFQQNNYGRGGTGNDYVRAEAQDGGGTNNANFSTPTDGGVPRMQMYLWNYTTPNRDGDLDNGIIIHEYGHGISIRLTGGPGTASCLNNQEQAGEGWSDYFAVLMTMQPGDTGPKRRGMGTYVLGQATNGTGIRTHPYTTDMSIDPRTYDTIKTATVPHGVGSVWAAMVWEMTWGLIDAHGWDANLYTGTGGNNIALRLVIDGLKLQPCSPGFVDARNAILLADQNNNGGANQCIIWTAFAKRGLGYSATQGSSNNRSDGTQAFNLPPACSGPTPTPTNTSVPPTPTNTSVPPTATNTPPPSSDVFFDNFETSLGWVVNPNGTDNATTGQWERGNPEDTNSSGPKQLGTTVSGSNDLVTGRLAGSSAGSYDIDGGTTSIRSPNITLPSSGNITLSFSYYLAHGTNSSSADFLRVQVVGNTTSTVFEELGAANNDDAVWSTFSGSLNSFAGQTVYLLISAADASTASLVEAAIDDVRITGTGPTATPTATNTPVPPTPTNTPVPPTATPPPSSCTTYTSTNVPINLPNGTSTISSNLTISGAGTIGDLNVSVTMAHTWVGDLRFVLRNQTTGTAVTIIDRPGVPASTYGCSGDNINATLDDEAASPVENQCASGTPTINGTFTPNNSLSAFDGQSGNGTWVLEVTDLYTSADAGTLNAWSVRICTP